MKPAHAADVRMFVRHEVADYAIWLKAYDAFNKERRSVRGDVTVTHDFRKAETAKAFATSARLKEVIEKAGVRALRRSGSPTTQIIAI